MTVSLRPYRTSDFDNLYALWEAALGTLWPITPEYLRRMVSGYARYQEGDHTVVVQAHQVIGFVATQTDSAGTAGGIQLLIVHPANQRQGIGTRLNDVAVERLRTKGVQTLSLAHGGGDYFWCGVPLNLPGAVDFFKSCDWDFPYTNYDLTQDLIAYQTPPGILERIAQQNIAIHHPSSPDETAAVLDFERRIFPFWAEYFDSTAAAGRYSDILTAWDGTTVVGSLLLEKADIKGLSPSGVWNQILGDDIGSIGAVGVDEAYRRRGIGVALVARASEILQSRGVRQCVIGWTDELEFYGKVGYKIWRTYAMTEN